MFNFPFGSPLRDVEQTDRTPKPVFVLGVYSSAVHARWIGADGKTRVRALAVASEPSIFWRGEGADEIVSAIPIPRGAGSLVPAPAAMNGPSGRSLDGEFLEPLGIDRGSAWLCDLLPHACLNPDQAKALARAYAPLTTSHGLPPVTLPSVPKKFADRARLAAIAAEIAQCRPSIVVTLGDVPLAEFVALFAPQMRTLRTFGAGATQYGRLHDVTIDGVRTRLLPLAHPRQVSGLGRHSPEWRAAHERWARERPIDALRAS